MRVTVVREDTQHDRSLAALADLQDTLQSVIEATRD